MAGATFEARRRRSSSLKLAGLMIVFLAFALAVLFDEGVLAGDGPRHINHRGTQLVFAWATIALVARMLPMALLDLIDDRPAIRFHATGGSVRTVMRRRQFRWEDVIAIEGGAKGFKIRLTQGRPIPVAGEIEGHDLHAVHAQALTLWMATAHN